MPVQHLYDIKTIFEFKVAYIYMHKHELRVVNTIDKYG